MDAVSDDSVERVVIMSCSQIGKTEIEANTIGYYIEYDPCPILVVYPTETLAKAFSEDRLSPMLRDTPCLRGRVKDPRSRDSKNTKLHKMFPGGHISMVGSNSPASLAARPIRIVLFDEVDRYPRSSGGAEGEGDVITLASARTKTFFNRKIIMVSTPTIKDISRIEMAYEESDKRRFYVPCHECDEYQTLKWGQVKWDKDASNKHLPETALYLCEFCNCSWDDKQRYWAVKKGEWRAEAEFKGIAGFHLNELYSPWARLSEIVSNFLEAKKSRETLKAFINTSLGETWEEEGEQVDNIGIYTGREEYGPEIPMNSALLTAGVDVQDDRLECEIVAWGKLEESWSIDYSIFHGSPALPGVWKELDEHLSRTWEHESGAKLKISCVCIDSGGHHTKQVYDFVKPRQSRRVFAIKGSSTTGRPIVSRPSINNMGKVKLFTIGTDTAKDLHFSRLQIKDQGPGYCHFPAHYDEEYFRQLTAEKRVPKFKKGFRYTEYVKTRVRNEALDARVYSIAALSILSVDLINLVDKMQDFKREIEDGIPMLKKNKRRIISKGV